MVKTITIKPAQLSDAAIIASIGRTSFIDTFEQLFYKKDDLYMHLDRTFTEEAIAADMGEDHQYFFALYNNEPAGFSKLIFHASHKLIHELNACELQKIYVLNKFHGHGPGQLLINKMMEAAKSITNLIWLSVHESNIKAQSFYYRNGFRKAGNDSYFIGSQEFHFHIMKCDL